MQSDLCLLSLLYLHDRPWLHKASDTVTGILHSNIKMLSLLMETCASFKDPTPMANAHSILQHRRELITACTRLAKVDSRYQFVSTCLQNHAIPQGLHINIKLSVPKSLRQEPTTHLEKEWAQITKRAAWGYLVALRCYHGSCTHHPRLQVANLVVSIFNCLWRRNALPTINLCKTIYNTWTNQLQDGHKRKLNKLLPLESHTK